MNYYNEIKDELLNYEINKKVKEYSINKSELESKYNVGKLLFEAQGGEKRAKYGNKLIKEYSEKLYKETGIKYSERSLRQMRQFYMFSQHKIWQTLSAKSNITWSHIVEFMKIDDLCAIKYYLNINNISVRQLKTKIRQKEYERLPQSTKDKLLKEETNYEITDFIKDPIIVKNPSIKDKVSEKVLHKMILENLDGFLLQLGQDFTYIAHEYKIKIGNRYNYIDFLLYNIKYKAYVVVEFKTTEFQAEYISQVKKYMNYIDRHKKTTYEDTTIGILICRRKNSFELEYCSDPRVFITTYKLISI